MEDYLLSVYDFITKQDNTFSGDVDIDTFKSKMQDDSYAKEIYGYMSSVDKSFASDLDESAFIQAVKKKTQLKTFLRFWKRLSRRLLHPIWKNQSLFWNQKSIVILTFHNHK